MSGIEDEFIDTYACPMRLHMYPSNPSRAKPFYWILQTKNKNSTIFLLSDVYVENSIFTHKIVVRSNFELQDFDNIDNISCSYDCRNKSCDEYVDEQLGRAIVELVKMYYYRNDVEIYEVRDKNGY